MEAFSSALHLANLNDLGYRGFQYTWTNGRGAENNVLERLDRFTANSPWIFMFSNYQVLHLLRQGSD